MIETQGVALWQHRHKDTRDASSDTLRRGAEPTGKRNDPPSRLPQTAAAPLRIHAVDAQNLQHPPGPVPGSTEWYAYMYCILNTHPSGQA